MDHVHRPPGHRPDHLHQRGPGPGARGPGRELQHRRVPRQDRRLRRAAPARPPAPGRRAGAGRGQPAQHRRPGHDRRSGPAGRSPGHRHRRHRPARRRRGRGNVPAAGPRGPRRAAARGPPVRRGSGSARPASGSATATWPRSPPTTGTAASAAPTNKPPTTAPHRCGSPTTCAARTCCCWPGPTPKPPSCPAASRPSSPRSAAVGPPQAALADGNQAGVGDLVRARLNTEIDAGGRQLTNRDTLKVTAFRGPDAEVRRQRPDGTWTEPFRVPRSYLARNAELGYGGNVHVAQGRTVDTAHLLVTEHPVRPRPCTSA